MTEKLLIDVFFKLLNMSITATYITLAVFVLRLLLRRAPRWMSLIMWAAVALRLVCPFTLESVVSLIPSAEPVPQDIVYAANPAINSGIDYVNSAVNPLLSATMSPSGLQSANPLQIISAVAAFIWIGGMAVMLLYTAVSYITLRSKVKESVPYDGNVRICDRIASPFILGVLRPRIYLPSNISEADAPYVIAHEERHLKRLDHLWKPLGFLILSVYWFNPVLWVAYVLLCRDIEAACDEAVLKNAELDIKGDYATALINCSVSRRSIAACPLAFGEVGVKARIKNVLSYKKPAFWVILAGILACAVLTVCFLTDPASIKIAELSENATGSQETLFDDVSSLTVYNGKLSREVTDKETVLAVIEELKKVELKKSPISDRRDDGRDMTNRVQLNDGKQLCFSDDYSEFWIYTGTKPTLSYKVLTPAYARVAIEEKSLLSSVTDYVETSGGTSLEDVRVMLQGIVHGEDGYIEVAFVNSSDKEITVGDKFELYRIVDGEQINCMDEDKMFDLLGYMLHAGGVRRYKYSLDKVDTSKPGTYRFVTSFSTETDGKAETHEAWLEFSLHVGDDHHGTTEDTINEIETEPTHEHSYTLKTTIDNGCDSFLSEIYVCSECGEEKVENGDKKGEHSYELVEELSATCMSAGVRKFSCKICSDTYSEDTPSLGHRFIDATCTSPSLCTECGAVEGDVLPHSLTYATCTVPSTCTVCGVVVGEVIPHTYTDATCTIPATCTVCGEVYGTTLDHDFAPATMESPKTCRICGTTEGEALPKLTIDMKTNVADTVSVSYPVLETGNNFSGTESYNVIGYQVNIFDISYDILSYNEEKGYEVRFNLNAQKINSHNKFKNSGDFIVYGYVKPVPGSEGSIDHVTWSFEDIYEGDIINVSSTIFVMPGNYNFLVTEKGNSIPPLKLSSINIGGSN